MYRVCRGASILPVYAGEIQARSLGAAVYAFNERGEKVVNQVGEWSSRSDAVHAGVLLE